MRYRSFFICLILFISFSASGNEYETPESLQQQVEHFLIQTLMEDTHLGHQPDIEVKVSNIDPRLRLNKCDEEPTKSITSSKPYGKHLSVKLTCNSQQRWSIYVPAQISLFDDILVLSQNIERGGIISENNVLTQRMDITSISGGYVKQKSRIIGMQLKRRLGQGQAICLEHLKMAQIIKKGDKVVLEANSPRLSVVTTGKALSSGSLGEQIQVQNEQSRRIIDAKIIAPGRVQILL